LVYATVTGAVSPRVFSLCAILLMLGLFIGFAYRFRSVQATKGGEDSNPSLQIAIIVMLLLLLNGLWFTQGAPLLPRIVGAAINLFITACFVFLLRRAKKADSASDDLRTRKLTRHSLNNPVTPCLLRHKLRCDILVVSPLLPSLYSRMQDAGMRPRAQGIQRLCPR
jgi:Ca2+/Na+ antiporter